jgi:hypothetical protein
VTRRRAAALVLLTGIAGIAVSSCRRAGTRGGESGRGSGRRVTISACPAPVASDAKGVAPLANLILHITTVPQVGRDTEATVRMEGETIRNAVRVDASVPAPFALAKGVYVVRVSLGGYGSAEGRVTLTAGCEATMAVELRRGSK